LQRKKSLLQIIKILTFLLSDICGKLGDNVNISIQDAWKKVVDNLSGTVGQETINLWIKPTYPVSLVDGLFTLSVPNIFFSKRIEENYQNIIEKTLSEFYVTPVKIAFQVQKDVIPIIENIEKTPIHPDVPLSSTIKDQINSKYTFDRFVVGNSNRFAQASAEAVAKNPGKQFNPLFIYSGVGLGKTHLLHAIGNAMKQQNPNFRLLYTSCEKFVNEFIAKIRSGDSEQIASFKNKYRNLDCLFIDDIQFLMDKDSSQEEFFNIFNELKDSGKQIVIASDRPQNELNKIEERLISRFKWGNTVDIKTPDLETRIAILRKKAEEENFAVPDDIILFVAKQIKSNIRELEGALLRVTSFIKFTNTPFTLDTVKTLLKDVIKTEEDIKITIDKIQQIIADEYTVAVKDLKGKKRCSQIVMPRQIAMYLARTMTDASTTEIGDAFGGKDHTTVMHACNKIKEKVEVDAYFAAHVNKLIKIIKTEE